MSGFCGRLNWIPVSLFLGISMCGTGLAGSSPSASTVTIERDIFGIPHITGPDRKAAFYGVGWATAEDRLFQMEISRRVMRGRLSEIAIANHTRALNYDRRAHLIAYGPHADRVAGNIPDASTREILQAFADGVNDYVTALGTLPQSFQDVGITQWDPWVPGDSLLCWWRVQISFDTQWMNEPSKTSCDAGTGVVDLSGAITSCPVGPPGCENEEGFLREVPLSMIDPPRRKASHGVAVAGSHTTSGEAVLLGEPRLPVRVPSVSYEYHVKTLDGEFNVRGMSMAGSLGMLVGFNESISWTGASGGGEQSDLYEIELGPTGGYMLDANGKGRKTEHPFVFVDTIPIYSDPARRPEHIIDTVTRRYTIWGPMVTDVFADCGSLGGKEYALRSVFLDETNRHSVVGLLQLMRASDWCSTRDALREYRGPGLQFLYADKDGHIGFQTLSLFPLRAPHPACPGNPVGWGGVPYDGSTILSDWQGIVTIDDLPWAFDPPEGYLVIGNNLPADPACVPNGLVLAFPGDTERSWRLREKMEELTAGGAVDPVDVLALHRDAVSPTMRVFVQLALMMDGLSQEAQDVLARLAQWNDTLPPGEEWSAYLDIPYVDPVTGEEKSLSPILYSVSEHMSKNWRSSDKTDQYGASVPASLCAALKDAEQDLAAAALDPEWIDWVNCVLSVSIQCAAETGSLLNLAKDYAPVPVLHYQASLEEYCGDECLTGSVEVCSFDPSHDFMPNRPLKCSMTSTIWSPLGQVYSQFVHFGDLDASLSVTPVGQSEDPTSFYYSNNEDEWIQGNMNFAPLDQSQVPLLDPPTILTYDGS